MLLVYCQGKESKNRGEDGGKEKEKIHARKSNECVAHRNPRSKAQEL